VAVSCEYSDEPGRSGAMELITVNVRHLTKFRMDIIP
jgi:hypothetical protein